MFLARNWIETQQHVFEYVYFERTKRSIPDWGLRFLLAVVRVDEFVTGTFASLVAVHLHIIK
jgi:hypothetical protein